MARARIELPPGIINCWGGTYLVKHKGGDLRTACGIRDVCVYLAFVIINVRFQLFHTTHTCGTVVRGCLKLVHSTGEYAIYSLPRDLTHSGGYDDQGGYGQNDIHHKGDVRSYRINTHTHINQSHHSSTH